MIENYYISKNAEIVQLVERDLPKVDVEGSSPFFRSKTKEPGESLVPFVLQESEKGREPEKRVRQKSVRGRSPWNGFLSLRRKP